MATGGQLGSGVQVAYSLNNSPQTWIEIPEILDVVVPAIERDRVESTVHGTTSLRTYIPGLGDVRDGELTLRANLTAGSVHLALQALNISQDTIWVRYEVPDTSNLSTTNFMGVQMQARVSSWLPETPIDGIKTISVKFQHQDNFFQQPTMAAQF
jgi:hypothetical protein